MGTQLRDFDVQMCDDVVEHFRTHLRKLAIPPQYSRRFDYSAWHYLTPQEWIGNVVAGLNVSFAEKIWAGLEGDTIERPLSDIELAQLANGVMDVPMRCEKKCVWDPCKSTHERALFCAAEIRSALAPQSAQEWAVLSAQFAAKLCKDEVPLADGIVVAGEWLRCSRRFQAAIELAEGQTQVFNTTARGVHSHRVYTNSSSDQPKFVKKGEFPLLADPNDLYYQSDVCDWREAMFITGLKKTKLYELFHQGHLKGYRDGTLIRFYRSRLVAYMRDRENNSPTPVRFAQRPKKSKSQGTQQKFKYL